MQQIKESKTKLTFMSPFDEDDKVMQLKVFFFTVKTIQPLEWLKLRRLAILSAGENCEQMEFLYVAGLNAEWYGHHRKQFNSSLCR